jgi:hypothetical protein
MTKEKISIKELADIEGFGRVVELEADFYTELERAKRMGTLPITPRDEASVRLKTHGPNGIGRVVGTRTSAGFEEMKGEPPILRLESRLLNPELAKISLGKDERDKQRVYLPTGSVAEYEESFKQAKADLEKPPRERNVILFPSRNRIYLDKEENWDIYESIFKDQAESYFNLSGVICIAPLSVFFPREFDSQNGTVLTQVWMRDIGGGSGLYGDHDVVPFNTMRAVIKTAGGKK